MHLRRPLAGLVATIAGLGIAGCALIGEDGVPARGLGGGDVAAQARGERDQTAGQAPGSVLSTSAATGGLLIELPMGFTIRFEPVRGLSADEQAALTDTAVLFAAWYQAIGRGDIDDPLYGRYTSSAVRSDMREVVAMFRANGWTVTGSVLVNRRSARLSGDTAEVAWCADLRDAYPMERASGHVLRSPSGNQSFVRYATTMERNDAGIWVATTMSSKRGAAACLPRN